MNLKNSGDSTGFEPMTSAMPVQCSNQLSYEVTQWRAGQSFPVKGMSYERNVRELRRRERVFQDGLLTESAYSSTFHKAIEFSLKKLGKPKLELRREQYDAIRAICFERKDVLAVLPTGFRKSLIYREFLTTFEAAVSLNVIILLCLLCHPEAGL